MRNSLWPHGQRTLVGFSCRLPGSSVHRIFQTRILEWVGISSSRRSSCLLCCLLHWQAGSLPLVPLGKHGGWDYQWFLFFFMLYSKIYDFYIMNRYYFSNFILFYLLLFFKHLFIWLHWVLVATYRLFFLIGRLWSM